MTEESAVKVCVRVRPLIQREEASVENAEPVPLYWKADKQTVHQVDDGNITKSFSFDRVFSAEESTNQLYQDIAKPLVVSAVEGYNGTIFAYGQTSSGKTFTMMGNSRIPGVIPLAMEDVFQTIKNCPKKEFLLRVSYMEIYNETVTDLLCDSWKRKPLEIREGNYFASAAKRMKNDPHVTEVSDDGALLRRYRNEIVDLKRRLQEVSSVTQTTATEKEVLAQLLQEKDQLQREQQDRIRNLTKIIVTSSNFVAAEKKIPKRRVTWGGKLLRTVQLDSFHTGDAEFGPSEPLVKKRKAELEFASPGRLSELSDKVASLELQLQMEMQQKQEAEEMNASLAKRVAELEKHLDVNTQESSKDLQEESSMTEDYERMKTEVMTLSSRLEAEKSRFKKMQADLQRELQVAFEENTKLTTLLDGKVPKNLIDSIELERTVSGLKKAVEMHQEQENSLQTKVEELEALKELPAQVEKLQKQICDLRDELCAAQAEKECLVSAQVGSDAEIKRLTDEVELAQGQLANVQAKLADAEMREDHLSQQHSDITKQFEALESQLEHHTAEKNQLLKTLEELSLNTAQRPEEEWEKLHSHMTSLTEERDQLQQILEGVREERSQLKSELQVNEEEMVQIQEELRQQQNLNSELQALRGSEQAEHQQQIQQLAEELEAVKEEKIKLTSDLQENTEMATETQRLLNSIQEELKQQQELNSDLKTQSSEMENRLEQQVKQLNEELQLVRSERDALQSERADTAQRPEEEWEKLHSHMTSLTEERDQLQQILEGVREERSQLKSELQEHEEMVREKLRQEQHLNMEQVNLQDEGQAELQQQIQQLGEELDGLKKENSQLKCDMQENVEMMIENQEELRIAQEKIRKQQQVIQGMKNEISDLESKQVTGNQDEGNLSVLESLQNQIKQLNEELQLVRSERDALQSERAETAQRPEEEWEKLHSHMTSLTEERDQLQQILEGVREERSQLKSVLQENEEESAERQAELISAQEELQVQQKLNSDLQAQISEKEAQLQEQMVQVQEELRQQQNLNSELQALRGSEQTEHQQQIQLLAEELEAVKEEKIKLTSDLQENTEMATETQRLLNSIQEELKQQQELNSDLKTQSSEMENRLEQQVKQLNEELQLVRSERDALQSERADTAQKPEEEWEKLHSHMTSLTEERDQLQQIVESVREERSQLKRNLQESEEMVRELTEVLEGVRKESRMKAELEEASRESLSEANKAISSLREQISDLERKSISTGQRRQRLCVRLEESEQQLQDVFEKCKQFADNGVGTSKSLPQSLKDASLVQNELAFRILGSIPRPLRKLYVDLRKSTDDINDLLWRIPRGSAHVAKLHSQQLEAQVLHDMACFEESRMQDLLILAAQHPGDALAMTRVDLQEAWDQRLSDLLGKRELKMQEMNRILADLEEVVTKCVATVSEELPEQERTNEELRALISAPSLDLKAVENLLEREQTRRSVVVKSKKSVFLTLQEKHVNMGRDLEAFKAQASQQLKEERSKSLTLLQKRESGPAKSEADLLQKMQELLLRIQQSEEDFKTMQVRTTELEEALVRAENKVSSHKEATQLLQTELQDTCAQLKERDDSIQSLQDKLEKMTVLLGHKEEALRKLKEALREAQQQGDRSFMEEPIHSKVVVTTGGRTVQSTVLMEKNRLDEEVKQLEKKTANLESLVSSQQLEISKWKARATKLKENKREGLKSETPLSPRTPTKRRRADTEGLILDSPKSKFFDAHSISESMSINCPKQFFDNSNLGTVPDLGTEVAVEDKNAEWWPMTPTQSDNCKTQ
ncbi:hypothetical protein JZ751_001530 [Albula glossodonta]|uniref:Kinesin motor domain-containing protein n=1 Tax=Albula glossodonta TaxID=121402 RepID=A0A8T2PTR4_9TELE|nr:hypothetical protein JZ751_001530 [Albula glossodonta]